MDIRQSIFWHQGLFLQPQHFQHLEMHQHYCRQSLMRMISPYPWGVSELSLSEQALSVKTFEIRQLKLLLSDQTYIEFPGNTIISPRSFDNISTDSDEKLVVYVGIRRFSQAVANVTVVDSTSQFDGVQTRFASLSNPSEQRDLYSDNSDAVMPTIVHIVKVFFEGELGSLDDYDIFPIAQLVRESDQIRLVQNWVPAVCSVNASSYLTAALRDIRDDLLGRARQLEEYKNPRDSGNESLDANFITMMQAVQVLNRQVPLMTHLIESSFVHPWDAYGALRVCVGELSTFSHRLDLYGRQPGRDDGMPAYDHQNIAACFDKAKLIITQLLAEVSAGPEHRIILTLNEGYFSEAIPTEYFSSRNRFFLILQTEFARDFDVSQFIASSRMAATSDLPGLIDHALPGLELIELSGPPQGLPRRADARYFRIEQVSEAWERVATEGHISLYWPEAPADLKAIVAVTRG
jgi:type VI secretion system protein ImpJ